MHRGEFRLTPNQNVIVAGVEDDQKAVIDGLCEAHGLDTWKALSALRLNAMACVAFPTCSLAMAEAERYLPDLLGEVEALMAKHGVADEAIITRMTGCPNGCARPYLAEIGLVGKAPGRYNLHLGAAADGTRLNTLAAENEDHHAGIHHRGGARLFADLHLRPGALRRPDHRPGCLPARVGRPPGRLAGRTRSGRVLR